MMTEAEKVLIELEEKSGRGAFLSVLMKKLSGGTGEELGDALMSGDEERFNNLWRGVTSSITKEVKSNAGKK